MFFNGRTYEIRRASTALQVAIRDYIREQLPENLDGLERYEAIDREASSLRVCAFMVKHLVEDFPPESVTASTKDFLLRMIHLKHVDSDREAAIEARDARNWFDEQQAKEKKVPPGVRRGRQKRVRKADRVPKHAKAAQVRAPKLRAKVRSVRGVKR